MCSAGRGSATRLPRSNFDRAPVSGSGSWRLLAGRGRALTTRPFKGTGRAFRVGGEAFFAGAGAFFPLGGLVFTAGRDSLGSAAGRAVSLAAPSFFEAAGLFGILFFLAGCGSPVRGGRTGTERENLTI